MRDMKQCVSVKIIWLLRRKCITQGQERGRVPEGCGNASGGRRRQPAQGRELPAEERTISYSYGGTIDNLVDGLEADRRCRKMGSKMP